jgi:hypothetical protein
MVGVRVEEADDVEPLGARVAVGSEQLLGRDQIAVHARVLARIAECDRALDPSRVARVAAHEHAAALLGIGARHRGVNGRGERRGQAQRHRCSSHSGSSR